jgi:hypothetical protein
MGSPEPIQHVVYIPKDAPLTAAASACFPYLPKSAQQATAQYREGGQRVLITITVQELE